MNDVLAEKEIFGPNVANSALEGNYYVNGKKAINIIVEALQKLHNLYNVGDIVVGLGSILKVYFLVFVGHTCVDIHNSDRIYRSMLKYYLFK